MYLRTCNRIICSANVPVMTTRERANSFESERTSSIAADKHNSRGYLNNNDHRLIPISASTDADTCARDQDFDFLRL